ncbi:MAG: DUF1553 domain-containing protein [Verrucomicrobia bacterium]|nr:DUF1553 domain-containing protein [Verrucomicrobiota bacterium]
MTALTFLESGDFQRLPRKWEGEALAEPWDPHKNGFDCSRTLPRGAVNVFSISITKCMVILSVFFVVMSSLSDVSEVTAADATDSESWVFQPIRSLPMPSVRDREWLRNPVDSFILARLERENLRPSLEADRTTLIRRLSFDLNGFPPAPEEIDQFVNDRSPDAYEALVDRLLASPRYGERWARHWLDIARFTESQGFEYDHMRPNAWHYRDYVIRSFNTDKPYDQFVKEQIAGDAMDPVTSDRIVATSLLVCGAWDQAGNSQANATQRAATREEELEDLISVVSQSFLGITLNCARCHAHKFDPIPQQDYYRVKSVFEAVRHGERVIAAPETVTRQEEQIARLKQSIAAAEANLSRLNRLAWDRAAGARHALDGSAGSVPAPLALWTFDGDARDSVGSLHGTLKGGAVISGGRLRLDGKGDFMETDVLPVDVGQKSLEVWLSLSGLEQGGGGALTLETKNGSVFDSIVFGEREKGKWTAGSNGLARTQNLEGPAEYGQTTALIHVLVVYRSDNSIAVFRNGEAYGEAYRPGEPLQAYRTGDSHVLIGKRHTGGGKPFIAAEIEQAALYDRALTADEVRAVFSASRLNVRPDELAAALSEPERIEKDRWIGRISANRAALEAVPPLPVSYAGIRKQSEPTHLLSRGDVKLPAEIVSPGALSSIPVPPPDFDLSPDSPEAERRLRFAEWVADPRNPLTPRAIVNRVWHHHFGRGIVATPNDLGASGAKPSHPELLDWLAKNLIDSGWSLKALHRLIVCSSAYRQASMFNSKAAGVDADNHWLWRFSPGRLDAEAVRDSMLALGGRLNEALGGPSFRPFDTKSFNATFYFPTDKPGPECDRRTIYRMNVNSGKDPLLDAFDAPDPSIKTPNRNATTTPLQSLGLMNSPFVLRQAGWFAERMRTDARGQMPRAIKLAYRNALGRFPTAEEFERAAALSQEAGFETLCWALFNATEFVYVR